MTVVGNDTAEKAANEAVQDTKPEAAEKEANMFDNVGEPTKAPAGEDHDAVAADARIPGYEQTSEQKVRINTDTYSQEDLVITPREKAAFIDAMISGDRYRQTMTLFGGKVSVVIRSRTAAETHAMYAYIRHTLALGGSESLSAVEGDMAYVPLVAQIEEINGTAFPPMKEPLMYTESDGKEVPPGWLEDFKTWKSKPEGLTSALISCVQLFEYKYWTMTREASNKNFWNSDTSTEG